MKTPVPLLMTFWVLSLFPTTHLFSPGLYFSGENDVLKVDVSVTEVKVTGDPGAYTFDVTLRSPDTGCAQFANWWEVVDEEGNLLYRRILAHSHVNEQPFTRSGRPVPVAENQTVVIRGHMNNSGYGSTVMKGSVVSGFRQEAAKPGFAESLENIAPQPRGCAF
jgi:hypothetical protein